MTGPMNAIDVSARRTAFVAEMRATGRLAFPLVLAQVGTMAISTTDVVMIGWLGPGALAAASLAQALFFPLLMFGFGVASALAPLAAQGVGRRDLHALAAEVSSLVVILLAIGAVGVGVLLGAEALLGLARQDETLVVAAGAYLDWAAFALPFAYVFMALRHAICAFEQSAIIGRITWAGVLINAAGNWILMFGLGPIPAYGLAGAAMATVAVHAGMLALLLVHGLRRRRHRRWMLAALRAPLDPARIRANLELGLPIGVTTIAEVLFFASAAIMAGWISAQALAAHAIALQLASIAFMLPLGLSHATAIRVGLGYARGGRRAAALAGWVSFTLGATVMATTALLFLAIPDTLVRAFLPPDTSEARDVLAMAAGLLAIAAVFQIVDGLQVT
ncbi:MAG: MATE family efflux transporter, partial [Rubricella sp.]